LHFPAFLPSVWWRARSLTSLREDWQGGKAKGVPSKVEGMILCGSEACSSQVGKGVDRYAVTCGLLSEPC